MAMQMIDSSGEGEGRVILGTQLRKAREVVQFPPQEVAARLGIGPEEILDWEADRTRPRLRQLERLAELYGREIDYFLTQTASPPAQIQFRSATPRSFKELSEEARLVIARFDELCRAAFELERTLGKTQPTVQRAAEGLSPNELAAQQRTNFGFGEKPIRNLRNYLTQKGIRVFELPVPSGQFSGFSYWHEEYGPCVLVNASEIPGRRNFTLAHEYAHLLYGHAPGPCAIDEAGPGPADDERLAHLFAIEFLLPAKPVREDFAERGLSLRPSLQEVGSMAGRWQVSVQAMLYRLEELKLVGPGYARDLLASYQPKHFKGPKGPRWRRRLGEKFVENALDAYDEGHISLGKLARYLGLPLRKALEAAETMR